MWVFQNWLCTKLIDKSRKLNQNKFQNHEFLAVFRNEMRPNNSKQTSTVKSHFCDENLVFMNSNCCFDLPPVKKKYPH